MVVQCLKGVFIALFIFKMNFDIVFCVQTNIIIFINVIIYSISAELDPGMYTGDIGESPGG